MSYRRHFIIGIAIAVAISFIDRAEPMWWSLLKEKIGALHTIAESSRLPGALAVRLRRTVLGGPVYLQCEGSVVPGQYFIGLSPWTNVEEHVVRTGREELWNAIYDGSPFLDLPGYVMATEDATLVDAVLNERTVAVVSCVREDILDDMGQFEPAQY